MEEKESSTTWRAWFQGANFAIYSCHFLASWAGRMFGFAMGLFLISISPESLQLTATYGLTMGACVLLLGTTIGNWVDKTVRLKAALCSMILQNVFMIMCAGAVLILLFLMSETNGLDHGVKKFFYALIIGLAVSSRLLKIARVIVVERDWIIEISRHKGSDLSVMTSTFRRIDLVTKILAPIFTGQVMTYAGLKVSSLVISLWSMVSLAVEYFLIRRVYYNVPALRALKDTACAGESKDFSINASSSYEKEVIAEESLELDGSSQPAVTQRRGRSFSPLRLFDSFIILFRGFRTYMHYTVKFAGFALASLYLTVMGFDGITVGYATTQGISGSVLGFMMGTGAVFGIAATFTYPHIVRRLGLANTGVLALSLQLVCLSLCVISVWLPGSPFDPSKEIHPQSLPPRNTSFENCTQSDFMPVEVSTSQSTLANTPCQDDPMTSEGASMISVWVMLAGVVTARFGLWTADLAIIQLFLERVVPTERGIVNGFQSSLNQLMDFLKYALVAAIPHPHQFGLLIFISFFFISTGWTWMLIFAIRSRKITRKRVSAKDP